MEWCLTQIICQVWICTTIQQNLDFVILSWASETSPNFWARGRWTPVSSRVHVRDVNLDTGVHKVRVHVHPPLFWALKVTWMESSVVVELIVEKCSAVPPSSTCSSIKQFLNQKYYMKASNGLVNSPWHPDLGEAQSLKTINPDWVKEP